MTQKNRSSTEEMLAVQEELMSEKKRIESLVQAGLLKTEHAAALQPKLDALFEMRKGIYFKEQEQASFKSWSHVFVNTSWQCDRMHVEGKG
eukprot:764640-Hanusia_phi.AAC.1